MAKVILRPYQVEAIQALRVALSGGKKKQVLMMSVGSGKTSVASEMISAARKKGNRCVFICDRIELIEQTSARFDADGIPHGVIQGQHERHEPHQLVQIASIQTLAARKDIEFDFCVIDECHVFHKAHNRLMLNNPGSFFVGLSASPFTRGLGKHFDGMVVGATTAELIDAGFLVPPVVYAPATIDTSKVKTVRGEFESKGLAEASDKPKLVADIVKTWFKLGEGRQTICFATNVSHSKHLAREFNRRGIESAHIDAYTDSEERREILQRFKACTIKIVSSVDILTKGYDNPSASCLIQARPTKSLMLHIQQIGRVLRTFDGKTDAIILDHSGNHNRLGLSTDDLPTTLDDGNKKKDPKPREAKEKLPKPCPKCTYIKPAGVHACPKCGFKPELIKDAVFEPGELVELKKAKKARKEFSLVEKQAFLSALNGHAKKKGYRKGKGCYGWALHAYQEKFGCSPSSKMDWSHAGEMNEMARDWITHKAIANRYRKAA